MFQVIHIGFVVSNICFDWSSEQYEKIFRKCCLAEMVKYSVLSSSLLADFHFVIVVVGNSSELDLSRQVCSANK